MLGLSIAVKRYTTDFFLVVRATGGMGLRLGLHLG
jgi:hypothetical protein